MRKILTLKSGLLSSIFNKHTWTEEPQVELRSKYITHRHGQVSEGRRRMQIQTFFSRALYDHIKIIPECDPCTIISRSFQNAIHHLEKKVGILRVWQNRSACYVKMYQDVHLVDLQVKVKHKTLDHHGQDE